MPAPDEDLIVARAGLSLDAMAVCEALLDGDLCEAQFCTLLVVRGAEDACLDEVADAARHVATLLARHGPGRANGVGQAVLDLFAAIKGHPLA